MSEPIDPLGVTPSLLLRAYASGIFPMAEGASADEIFWVDPKFRGIIPLGGFHISKSMRRIVRKDNYAVAVNGDFAGTVAACAERDETWINEEIADLYQSLHRLGYAHSVEIWQDDALVGGVYGVVIGGAFFGESMFSRRSNMSKLALVWLVARLKAGGFTLFDTQFITSHLTSLGAIEISRAKYHEKLEVALKSQANFFAMPSNLSGDQVMHLTTQTS